ncbi:uncharacterized protein [Onthophagus taurus]|uniref:uncharacterized protein n=1 Tax=Onthophagus taurus TaxID=166361 RepID=UPI0039BE992E
MSQETIVIELDKIKQIAHNNEYPQDVIEKFINTKLQKFNLSKKTRLTSREKPENKNYRTIQYQGEINGKIRKNVNKYNLESTSKNNNTLSRHLINNKDKINKLDDNGIYKLQWRSCRATYIGQTGRRLGQRIYEYKTQNSNLGKHLMFNTEHEFNDNEDATLIHKTNKGHLMEILENYEINKFKNNFPMYSCLNEQTGTTSKPLYLYLRTPFTPPKRMDKPSEERGLPNK